MVTPILDNQQKFLFIQLCTDTGYRIVDLLRKMTDKDGCQKRIKRIRSVNTLDYNDDDESRYPRTFKKEYLNLRYL